MNYSRVESTVIITLYLFNPVELLTTRSAAHQCFYVLLFDHAHTQAGGIVTLFPASCWKRLQATLGGEFNLHFCNKDKKKISQVSSPDGARALSSNSIISSSLYGRVGQPWFTRATNSQSEAVSAWVGQTEQRHWKSRPDGSYILNTVCVMVKL